MLNMQTSTNRISVLQSIRVILQMRAHAMFEMQGLAKSQQAALAPAKPFQTKCSRDNEKHVKHKQDYGCPFFSPLHCTAASSMSSKAKRVLCQPGLREVI